MKADITRRTVTTSLCCMLLASTIMLSGCIQNGQPASEPKANFSNSGYICELATLEVYYHNVARSSHEADWPVFEIGKKRMWFEYSGIVEVGIDATRLAISEPDSSNTITITMPQAEILNVNVDEGSISEPAVETAPLTFFTTEEKTEALSKAQQIMRDTANEDDTLKFQARERAKELLESYVTSVGESIGVEYTVKWADA